MSGGVLAPGATLGVLGGGQLGQMFAVAARRLGFRVAVWSDVPGTPALALADLAICAPYDDLVAFERFAVGVDAVTVEFENIPGELLIALEARTTVRPGPRVVAAFQHRGREKATLAALGLPLAPHRLLPPQPDRAAAAASLEVALAAVGRPAVLKTAGFGYDGKGQVLIHPHDPLPGAALALMASQETVLEAFVELAGELSVVVARSASGEVVDFPVLENHHRQQILDLTLIPARVPAQMAADASAMARRLVVGLELVGLVCVELFVTVDGELWVNEVAPRPHNSGHITLVACSVDQFEQQVRALAGLPLGRPQILSPGAMVNLLGDLWSAREGERAPAWAEALAIPGVHLHLYGKGEAKPGRKMGHLSALAADAELAAELVLRARAALGAAAPAPLPAAPVSGRAL